MQCLLWLLVVLATINTINAAEILTVSTLAAVSHWNVMSSVIEVLLNRGHKITVISSFTRKTPHENYTEIDLSILIPKGVALPWKTITEVYTPPIKCLEFLNVNQYETCDIVFNHPDVLHAISKRRYELVITELVASRCNLYLANHLGVPNIGIVSSQMLNWYQDSFDNPSNPSYISTTNSPYPRPESFGQRFWNVIDYIKTGLYFKYIDSTATTIGRKYFGDSKPDAETILRNVSMVFLNTHSNFDLHKPLAANFKEIGGIHLKPTKPLPTDLQTFIDNAEHGVIYFNLGSVVKMKDLPINIQNGIKETFAQLPQKILWKYESDEPLINKPKNVYTSKWFPQYDIIRHPNVKLFITHGGNSGVIEATSAGIPVLGFPIFFDQPRNLELFKYWGSGLFVDVHNFSKEDFLNKIVKILSDHRFRENALELSRRFHDRPISPQETVAYWTEYVLRHDGAQNLKSKAIETPRYQYFTMDIFILVLIAVASLIYSSYRAIFALKTLKCHYSR